MANKLMRLFKRLFLFSVLCLSFYAPLIPAGAQDQVCTLADHIRSANTNTAVGFCPAGTSHDIITIAEDITLTEPLPPITGTITIEGGGHTISGDGKYRIFDVVGGNLTIRNLTLRDGRADHGGAIRSQASSLIGYDNNFVGNRAEKSAGAIYANGGTLDIRESRFVDNCAQLASYNLVDGVNNDQRSVDSDGCTRIRYSRSAPVGGLQTKVDGGAIRLLNGAHANIENTTFAANRATYGGAVSTSSRSDWLVVKGSSFIGNHASETGGAIGAVLINGGTISITNSSFVQNTATGNGGAIEARRSRMEISNSTFARNYSGGKGGALQIGWGANVTVTHGTFVQNRAGFTGAAISKSDGTLFLRNSVIVSTGSAEDCVGGLDQNIGNLSRDRTCGLPLSGEPLLADLTGTPAHYPPLDRSPLVDVAVAEYCLETDQLGTERPQGGGCDIGAIESTTAEPAPLEALDYCPLPDQIIAANTDRPYGACPAGNGADTIYLIRDFVLTEKLQPITSDITIEGNGFTISGDDKFRIFDVDGGMLTVKNLTMTKGRVLNDGGGAIRLQNGGRALVGDSHFLNNSAQSGGAISTGLQRAGNSWLTVNNSSFVENRSSSGGGGALYSGNGRINVRNSSFINNSAHYRDGGAVDGVNFISVDIDNSTFIGNSPSAVAASNGVTVTLTHVTIHNRSDPPVRLDEPGWARPVRINLRNSIIAGQGIDTEDCDNLRQNLGNLIEDGSCSPRLSGDPILEEANESPAYLELQAGSPAVAAADARFCTETDQIGRARPIVGRCDIGAIQSIPVRQELSNCTVTTTHGLNLRDDPGGRIVGLVSINETLPPVARTPGWFNVEFQGKSGWISAEYVVTEGICG